MALGEKVYFLLHQYLEYVIYLLDSPCVNQIHYMLTSFSPKLCHVLKGVRERRISLCCLLLLFLLHFLSYICSFYSVWIFNSYHCKVRLFLFYYLFACNSAMVLMLAVFLIYYILLYSFCFLFL